MQYTEQDSQQKVWYVMRALYRTELKTQALLKNAGIQSFIPVKETIIRIDTLTLPDTLRLSDTVYVEIPITSKVYEDSLYKAWVSGYRARLDSIEVYPVRTIETVYVPQVKRTRWGIGLQAGFGTDLRGGWMPYVGVGVSYDLWGW